MDNLRSAIADKVLDISAFNGDDMKAKLEKINRFRDFANACQLLIKKYPFSIFVYFLSIITSIILINIQRNEKVSGASAA